MLSAGRLRPAGRTVLRASTESLYWLRSGFTSSVHREPGTDEVVGRAAERTVLQAALASARSGIGQVVLVTGPAGIGKTRVAELLAADAQAAGVSVRWGRCLADAGAPPLWPWRRVLQASTARAGEPDPALGQTFSAPAPATADAVAAARFALMASTADRLTAAAEPGGLVVVLEDLHWADEASLALLCHLAGEVRRFRLLVVATSRDSGVGPLEDALPDLLTNPGVRMLRLPPLPPAAVAAYLSQAAGGAVDRRAVALLHERSGGNPLYLRALVSVLGADLLAQAPDAAEVERRLADSPELRHLVAAVLRGLEPPVRHILDVASLLAEEVDAPLVAEVTGLPLAEVLSHLATAAAKGLLVPVPDTPGRQRFVHALVRDGVRADVSEADRMRWHARAAEALEQHGGGDAAGRAGEIAFHWLRAAARADELRRAVHWARTAAAQVGRIAPEEASQLLRRATSAARRAGVDDAEEAEILLELAAVEYAAGQIAASLEHSREAADAATRAGSARLQALAALVVQGIGHPATASTLVDLCDRALALDLASLELPVRARLLSQRAQAHCELGRSEQAREGSAAALAAAEACGDPQAVLSALHARVNTLDAVDDPQEREALADRALLLTPPGGQQPLARLWPYLWRLDAAYIRGQPAGIEREIGSIAALVGKNPVPLATWHLLRVRAAHAAVRGRFDEARAANDEAADVAVRLQEPSSIGMTDAFRCCLAGLTGDPADLGPDWLSVLADAPDLPIVAASRAAVMLLVGRPDAAAEDFVRVIVQAPALPRDGRWHGTLHALVEVAVGLDDEAAAATLHALLLPAAALCGGPGAGNMWTNGSGWRPVGRLEAVLGRHQEAAGSLEEALRVNRRLGAVSLAVHVKLDLAQVLTHPGPGTDRLRALRLAGEAAGEARRLGMPGPLERADRLLRSVTAAAQDADPLTRREREVGALVAQSLTNREVAERLFLSERTVESHVRSILAKLGLRRRTDVVLHWRTGDYAGRR